VWSSLVALVLLQGPQLPFSAPAGKEPDRVVSGGVSILPNGRLIKPAGTRLYTGDHLTRMTFTPDGNTLIAFHRGGFTEIGGFKTGALARRLVPLPDIGPAGSYTPNGKQLVVSLGEAGAIAVLDSYRFETVKRIDLNSGDIKDAFVCDLVLSHDGARAYALDSANQQLVTIDLKTGSILSRTKTGRQPVAVAISNDNQIFVANAGIFEYSLLASRDKSAFGYPSVDAEKGLKEVPGLGAPTTAGAESISMYQASTAGIPSFVRSVPAGTPVGTDLDGQKTLGGSAPCALLVHGDLLYVSNAHDDTVQVFATANLRLLRTFPLAPTPQVEKLRGVMPAGLGMNADATRLYVCETGLNAVAILDPASGKLLGQVPTGWAPVGVYPSPDGKRLFIADERGLGNGPAGSLSPHAAMDDRLGFPLVAGMIQMADAPRDADLDASTKEVLANNGLLPSGRPLPHFPPQIKHVVLIHKAGHTFDGVFGGLPGADGQPVYAQFGQDGWLTEKSRDVHVTTMPNHLRLAQQFAVSDNYYVETLDRVAQQNLIAGMDPTLRSSRIGEFRANDAAKGRLAGTGIPEDYPENGTLWFDLDRAHITYRNYGDGFEFFGLRRSAQSPTGLTLQTNAPMPLGLLESTDFGYPAFNTKIADVDRVANLEQDLDQKPMPQFLNAVLANDQMDAAREGYPFIESYAADNDLALGRLVEWLSHRPEWKEMAILISEDSGGSDVDHIDRQRTFLMCVSPYAKRGYLGHDHLSGASITKTLLTIFGLAPHTLLDAMATSLDDLFTNKSDFTPYVHVPVDKAIYPTARRAGD